MTLPPDLSDRLNGEGLAHAEGGRGHMAECAFRRALALAPAHLAAAGNLGNIEARRLSFDAALRHYAWGLASGPQVPALHLMRATAEIGRGHAGRGERSLRRAIALMPAYPKALSNLGTLLFAEVRPAEAERPLRRALACAADFIPALTGLGRLLIELAHPVEARALLRRAIAATPDTADGLAVLATLLQMTGRPAAAAGRIRRALAIRPEDARVHQQLLFTLVLDPETTNRGLDAEYRRWSARHSPPSLCRTTRARDLDPDRPLKVGYLSADLYEHPVAYLVEDLIRRHDRRSVLPYLFAEDRRSDATTARLKAAAQAWHSTVGLSDEEAARRIDEAGIDILVSLAGHTGDNRILIAARRPAPIQVNLHDLSTSGLSSFDYWLTDGHLHPGDTTEGRTETLVRLDSLYHHRVPEGAPAVTPLPAARRGFVTFGAFANPGKINDRVIGLWSRVLENVPTARLLLASRDAFSDPHLQRRYRDAFAAAGIAASRLLFDGRRLGRLAHLERVASIDIGLDPFPFTGGTATFEALWMGVPVVTLAGERFAARCGVTHLAQVGLSHLVAESEQAYVAIAAGLAREISALEGLRFELRERVRRSPLCDTPAYARSVERAYRWMWRHWAMAARGDDRGADDRPDQYSTR